MHTANDYFFKNFLNKSTSANAIIPPIKPKINSRKVSGKLLKK
jgi:hypothetical protein